MSLVDSTGTAIVPQYTASHNIQNASLELMQWQAQCEFDNARLAMDAELPTITKEGKIQFGGGKPIPFVRFEDLHAIIMPFLRKFGFYATFQGVEKNGVFWAQAFLRRNGCSIVSEWPVDRQPINKAMNPNQASAAGFSMACRHALIRLLNLRSLAPEDADTDAIVQRQQPIKTITQAQVRKLAADIGSDDVLRLKVKTHFLDPLDLTDLSQLPATQYSPLVKSITSYKARLAK